MSTLDEFKAYIQQKDEASFRRLWSEYCKSESVDSLELFCLMQELLASPLGLTCGELVDDLLPHWQSFSGTEHAYPIVKHVCDLQKTNNIHWGNIAYSVLEERYGSHPFFSEKIRLVGLRQKSDFQGCITHYELLTHMDKGRFVLHKAGWGVGEIVDISLVREQLAIEFENVLGRKELSFQNAFKSLTPLDNEHFLSRRFGNPDSLEALAKQDPLEVIRLLLKDLGGKTASEIKEELCELVIPQDEWSRWWPSARSKMKKDTFIESPENTRGIFRLRDNALSHESRLRTALEHQKKPADLISLLYDFLRDFSELSRSEAACTLIAEKIQQSLPQATLSEKIQLHVLLCDLPEKFVSHKKDGSALQGLIESAPNATELLARIEIAAIKKRVLVLVQKYRQDWVEDFKGLLFSIEQTPLKDYILKELSKQLTSEALESVLERFFTHTKELAKSFLWYFSKLLANEDIPFQTRSGVLRFFEHFLILLNQLETDLDKRDLTKKMYNMLTADRYALVRSVLEGTDIDYVREFLLLVAKCRTLSDHDIKIMHSLAQVVHPSLGDGSGYLKNSQNEIVWTTEQSLRRVQARIEQIGTEETVRNAEEVRRARELGDLRENGEYKAAIERRSRLQGELRSLSDQVRKARVITPDDVSASEVGIGSVVTLKNSLGKAQTYTILGTWDANPEENVLSDQSRFAQCMIGSKAGSTFTFQSETYTIEDLNTIFNKASSR